jgi:hypothetical protein
MGFRIDSKIGRASFLDLLVREVFFDILPPVKRSEGTAVYVRPVGPNAIAAPERCQMIL